MSSRTRAAYDDWATTYDTDPNPQIALEESEVLSRVDPRPGDVILDAACGTGRYSRLFLDVGARVVGFDSSPRMLERAREKCPSGSFLAADLSTKLPFDDGMFAKVCCAQALKHLPDLAPPIRELSRVLRSGGCLTFSVTHPDMDFTDYVLRDEPRFVLSERADVHHHRGTDYQDAIQAAGLALVAERALAVDERIASLLTDESFAVVRGRLQVLVVQARRPGTVTAAARRP